METLKTGQIELGLNWSQKDQSTVKTNFSRGDNREALELITWKPVVSSSLKESHILVTNIVCMSEGLTKLLALPSCPIPNANLPLH